MRITRTEGQWRSTRKSRALYTRAETGPQQLEELKLAFRWNYVMTLWAVIVARIILIGIFRKEKYHFHSLVLDKRFNVRCLCVCTWPMIGDWWWVFGDVGASTRAWLTSTTDQCGGEKNVFADSKHRTRYIATWESGAVIPTRNATGWRLSSERWSYRSNILQLFLSRRFYRRDVNPGVGERCLATPWNGAHISQLPFSPTWPFPQSRPFHSIPSRRHRSWTSAVENYCVVYSVGTKIQ